MKTWLIPLFAAISLALTAPVGAVSLSEDILNRLKSADVVLLGEVHDNPAHHQVQADLVAQIVPKALVFEMLTPQQATRATPDLIQDRAALDAALGWAESGWPDFMMYHPIFLAAPQARVFGAAVPRDAARAAMQTGIAESFGAQATQYGLTEPLQQSEQQRREALQMEAHCDALPAHLLPAMVDIQRLRDARLAQEAVRALEETGGPVAVITGNGHARADWGVPRFLRRVDADVTVFALGQSEEGGALRGDFDAVIDGPGVERPDPCAAFATSGG
ncbi:ChaN family lipoprotein [Aestuariivita sp.]|jgi:uncharacterized iron-regulated protein|uniref:ChaN family lipoprotein n=1 Tax=Aestuariivita sp. TaxID=1872407 RepID=UPI00216FF418|nr:ChaN family lipoprotein [Aestuariivita sp.]MCE8007573.1 ChaN family lipoprotein [Aestuariivita sp.]